MPFHNQVVLLAYNIVLHYTKLWDEITSNFVHFWCSNQFIFLSSFNPTLVRHYGQSDEENVAIYLFLDRERFCSKVGNHRDLIIPFNFVIFLFSLVTPFFHLLCLLNIFTPTNQGNLDIQYYKLNLGLIQIKILLL